MPINVINRPASECSGNAVYVGPTAVDFSMIPDASRASEIARKEAGLARKWRKQDFASYSHQTQRARWRH